MPYALASADAAGGIMIRWIQSHLSTKSPKEMRVVLLEEAKREIVHVQAWQEKYASDAQMLQARIDRLNEELRNGTNE